MDKLKAGDTVEYKIERRGSFHLTKDDIDNMEMIINDHLEDEDQEDDPPNWNELLINEIEGRSYPGDYSISEDDLVEIIVNGECT